VVVDLLLFGWQFSKSPKTRTRPRWEKIREGGEIECAKRDASYLGHESVGENLAAKNTRECVNSLSMRFILE
jgi:peptide methionine sulfoxide reductase MsrB